MSEATKASTGAKSEFWFNDGSALYKAVQVKSFGLPSPTVDQLESTNLDSAAKEFVPGDTDFGEFEVKLNLRPGSDTDTKIEAWVAAQVERAFKCNVAVRSVLTRSYDGIAIAVAYDHGEINRGGVMEATLRLRSTGAVTSSAYVAP
jgi:hypothetical protein